MQREILRKNIIAEKGMFCVSLEIELSVCKAFPLKHTRKEMDVICLFFTAYFMYLIYDRVQVKTLQCKYNSLHEDVIRDVLFDSNYLDLGVILQTLLFR